MAEGREVGVTKGLGLPEAASTVAEALNESSGESVKGMVEVALGEGVGEEKEEKVTDPEYRVVGEEKGEGDTLGESLQDPV